MYPAPRASIRARSAGHSEIAFSSHCECAEFLRFEIVGSIDSLGRAEERGPVSNGVPLAM